MHRDGILAGPVELDGTRATSTSPPKVEAHVGLVVEHRASGVVGSVVSFGPSVLVVRDRLGNTRRLRPAPGGFLVDGLPCSLVTPRPATRRAQVTASGSLAAAARRARVARASRLLVEGIHDAELVEKVWGDDLRDVGVVVERLDGMDHLDDLVRDFDPAPGRRLGILLDHLVEGSKEARAADAVRHPHVRVAGTPFVDVWAAIRPQAVGIEAWPEVPMGVPWKAGVLAALGVEASPGEFWRHLLGRVRGFADLDHSLVGAVESLIDFVTDDAV